LKAVLPGHQLEMAHGNAQVYVMKLLLLIMEVDDFLIKMKGIFSLFFNDSPWLRISRRRGEPDHLK
jgi:hypothetical protein